MSPSSLVSGVLENPWIITLPALVLAVLFFILRAILDRKMRQDQFSLTSQPIENTPVQDNEERKLKERLEREAEERRKRSGEVSRGDLAEKEKMLREREDRMKADKIRRLEDREKGLGGPGPSPDYTRNPYPGPEDSRIVFLASEKSRIGKMTQSARTRHMNGELNEENYRRIIQEYDEELAEIEEDIRKYNEEKKQF